MVVFLKVKNSAIFSEIEEALFQSNVSEYAGTLIVTLDCGHISYEVTPPGLK